MQVGDIVILMWRGVLFLLIVLTGCGVRSASNSTVDWPLYNGDYQSTRFSQLSDVSPRNVTSLRQVCAYHLPETVTFESGLVAVQGTLYFTAYEYTYAIEAGNCALKWRTRHPLATIPAAAATRGVAYWNGHVFRGSYDGNVIAYDAATGQQTWITKLTASDSGEFISAAPTRMERHGLHWHGRRRQR
jgi:alcohol dehydrogenase (cytochrome c)